jgi:hypothetical protein
VEGIIGDYQCGFHQGRSTNDQIFTIHQVLEKCNEFQIETHHLFIDFRSAYDSIDRDSLLSGNGRDAHSTEVNRLGQSHHEKDPMSN